MPYVEMPERLVPGVPLRFATALPLGGYGRGVVVTSMEGRPIKVEGNPRHPASLGSTDVFAEASVLSLYDPDRSKAPRKGAEIPDWGAFEAALLARLGQEHNRQGEGLAILTARITCPTLTSQIAALQKSMPQAKWYRADPIEDDAARNGATLAFGRTVTALPRFADARVALMLDADPIGPGPAQIRFARDITGARQLRTADDFLRIYAVEPRWTLTGALADHRIALGPELIRNVALVIARELGATVPNAELPEGVLNFTGAVAADLKSRLGRAIVLAGPRQPAEVHALCHWINGTLRAPVDFIEPVDAGSAGHMDSLRALAADIHSGATQTLIIIDTNPAYEAPHEIELAEAIAGVPFTVHLGPYDDETAARCTWHLPLSHPLESWSDLRAFDGTASIVQPLIRPLYDTRTAHELIALLGGAVALSSHDIVRANWQAQSGTADFTAWWRQTLQDGVIANSVAPKIATHAAKLPEITPAVASNNFTLTLAPDPAVWDGRMANNAWLQECPKPFTKEVWGNAMQMSPADGKRSDLVDGDLVRVSAGQCRARRTRDPARRSARRRRLRRRSATADRRLAALATASVSIFIVCAHADSPWATAGIEVTRTGRNQNVLRTQHYFALEGEAEELQPRLHLAELAQRSRAVSAGRRRSADALSAARLRYLQMGDGDRHSACIGCNACVVACQAENNVPVVGPAEIAIGRDMHWLRIDDYIVDGRPGFSPVPCMHCEHAPCEPVCPVAASVHDSEGLNLQVYNRCVGTRFCESNCPYKVRRFNFFGYADGQEYGELRRRHHEGCVQSERHGARPRRHGEVYLLRPAHQRGAP